MAAEPVRWAGRHARGPIGQTAAQNDQIRAPQLEILHEPATDPEASWGHRTTNLPGPRGEMFFGYYLSAGTMTREEKARPSRS